MVHSLRSKGMIYQAMQAFEEVLALELEKLAALRNLAVLDQNRGFRNKAIDMWERALRCSSDPDTREHVRKHLTTLINQAAS